MRIECSHGSEVRKSLIPGIMRNLFIFFFLDSLSDTASGGSCGNGFDAGEEGFPQRGHECGRSPESVYGFRNLLFSEHEAGRKEFYLLEMADFQKTRRRPRGIRPGFRRAGNSLQGQGERTLLRDPTMVFRFSNGRGVLKLDGGSESSSREIRGDLTDLEEMNEFWKAWWL